MIGTNPFIFKQLNKLRPWACICGLSPTLLLLTLSFQLALGQNSYKSLPTLISLETSKTDQDRKVKWVPYSNAQGAYSVEIPDVPMKQMDREVENPLDPEGQPYYMNIEFISDPKLDFNYLIRYNDQPEGYYLVNQEEVLETLGSELANGIELVGDPIPFEEQGVKGFIAYLSFFNTYNGVFKFYFRGNRSYAIMAQAKEKGDKVDVDSRFFTSFKLEPFQEDQISDFVFEDLFKLQAPTEMRLFTEEQGTPADEFLYTRSYTGTSDFTGGLYMVETSKLNSLYRTQDVDTYLIGALDDLLEYKDSIAEKELIDINGVRGIRARIVNPNTNVQQFIQTMYVDDHLVQLYSCVGQEEIDLGLINGFLGSFSYTRKTPKMDISAPKTKEIVAALLSSDTTQVKRGQTALLYHDFTTADIDLLLSAMPYEAVEDQGYEKNKTDLIIPITKLGNQSHMDGLLAYYQQDQTPEKVREEIVSEFLNFQALQADKKLMDLLLTDPPKRTEETFLAFYQLEDSLHIIKKYPQQLAALYRNDDFKDLLVGLYADYIMGEEDLPEMFSALQEAITEDIQTQLRKYNDATTRDKEFYLNDSLIYYYMSIAESDPAVDAEKSGAILKAIYTPYAKEPWTKTEALLKYMRMGYEADPEILKQYMDPFYSRYEIMEALFNAELSDVIPQQYLAPDSFTELCVYNYVGDYIGEYNNEVEKMGEIEDSGVRVGVYKVLSTSDESEPILAIGVIDSPDPEDFSVTPAYTEFDEVKTAWKAQARALLRSYKEALGE